MEEVILSDASGLSVDALSVALRSAYGVDRIDGASAFSIVQSLDCAANGEEATAMREALARFFNDRARSPSSAHDLLRHALGRGPAGGTLPSVFNRLPPVAVTGVLDVRLERPTAELQLFPGVPTGLGGNGSGWLRDNSMPQLRRANDCGGGGVSVVPRHGVAGAVDSAGSSPSRRSFLTTGQGADVSSAVGHLVLNLSTSRDDAIITSIATMLVSSLVVIGSSEECYHALHRISQNVAAGKAASSAVKPILTASGSSMASELSIILTTPSEAAADFSGSSSRRATVEASLKMLGHTIAATVRVIDVSRDAEITSSSARGGSAREVVAVQQEVGRAIARCRANNLRHDRPPLNVCHWLQLAECVVTKSRIGGGGHLRGGDSGLLGSSLDSIAASAVAWGTACYATLIDLLSPHSAHLPADSAASPQASAEEIHALAKWLSVDLLRELSEPFLLPGNPMEQLLANIHVECAKFRNIVKEGVYQHAQPLIRQCLMPLSLPLKLLCEGDASSTITSVSEWLGMVDGALRVFMSHRLHDDGTSDSADSNNGARFRQCSRWSEQAKRSAVYDMLVDWILPNTRVVAEIVAEKEALLLQHKDSVIRQANAVIAGLESTSQEHAADRKKLVAHELDIKEQMDVAQRRINEAQQIALTMCARMSKELSELHRRAVDAAFMAENGVDTSPSAGSHASEESSSSDGSDAEYSLLRGPSGDKKPAREARRLTKKPLSFAETEAQINSTEAVMDMCRALLLTLGAPTSLIPVQDHQLLLTLNQPMQAGGSPTKRHSAAEATRMRGFSPVGGRAIAGRSVRTNRGAIASVSTTATAASSSVLNQSAVSRHGSSTNASSDNNPPGKASGKDQTASIREMRRRQQRMREEEEQQRIRRSNPSSVNTSFEGEASDAPHPPRMGGILTTVRASTATYNEHRVSQHAVKLVTAASTAVPTQSLLDQHQHLLELREAHAATLRQLAELQQAHAVCKTTERRLEGHVATLEAQLRGFAMDSNVLSNKNMELQEMIDSLRSSLDKNGMMLDGESKKVLAAQSIHQELRDTVTMHEVTILSLSEFKKSATSDLQKYSERISELEMNNRTLHERLESALKEKETAQSLLQLTRVELDVDRSALAQSRSEAAELEHLLLQERSTLRDSSAKYERHISELLDKSDATTERLKQQVVVLERSVLELTQQLHAKEESHSAEKTMLLQSRDELTAQHQRLEKDSTELKRQCISLENALKEVSATSKSQSAAMEHDRASITVLKKELAFAKENIAKLTAELRHSEDLRGRLQHSVEAFDTLITEQRELSARDSTQFASAASTAGVGTSVEMMRPSRMFGAPMATVLPNGSSVFPLPQQDKESLQILSNLNLSANNSSTTADELHRLTEHMRQDVSQHHQLITSSTERGPTLSVFDQKANSRFSNSVDRGAAAADVGGSGDSSLVDDAPIGLSRLLRDEKRFRSTTNAALHTAEASSGAPGHPAEDGSGYRTPQVVLDSASTSFYNRQLNAGQLQRRVPVAMPLLVAPAPRSMTAGVRPIEPHLRVIAQVDALMQR
jgi:hypothetical protein